eukprot:COSAG02_NODE_877_length_16272_cov_8.002288_6_plen_55_part_00
MNSCKCCWYYGTYVHTTHERLHGQPVPVPLANLTTQSPGGPPGHPNMCHYLVGT